MIREAGQWKRGYLKLKIWGYGVERFLNVCGKTGIGIWNVRAEKLEIHGRQEVSGGLENSRMETSKGQNEEIEETSCGPTFLCCMELKDFRRIRPAIRKTKVHVRIQKRLGLPFFLHRNRKRWLLFAGPVLVFLILMVLSMFVWNVTFEGNSRYTDDALMAYLEKSGIRPGMLKSKISLGQLEEQIRLDYPEILWVSAQISGTQLSIKLRENDAVFSVPEKDTSPGNLVASADGTITRLVIRQGKALVKEGDQVEKGQVLAEGILELMNDNGELLRRAYVQADGEVYGTVRHTYRKRLDPMKKIQVKTGKKSGGFFLSVGAKAWGWVIPNFRKTQWISRTEEHQLRLGRDFYLPVWYGKIHREEIQVSERPYTKEEAKAEAELEKWAAEEKLLEKGVHIIGNNVKIQENGFSFSIEGEILCEEQIAVFQQIPESEQIPTESSTETGE